MTEDRSPSNVIYAADRFAARQAETAHAETRRALEIAERVKRLVGV